MKNRLAEIDFLFSACCFSALLWEAFVNLYALGPVLAVFPYFGRRLTCLFRDVRCGRIADGDDGRRIPLFGQFEKLLAELHAEVAHPAGAQPLFGCRQAQMFYGDGHVDVGMVFLVIPPCPGRPVVFADQDVSRSLAEPFLVVALLRARSSSPVKRMNFHGCLLTAEGARRVHSLIYSIVSAGMASGL